MLALLSKCAANNLRRRPLAMELADSEPPKPVETLVSAAKKAIPTRSDNCEQNELVLILSAVSDSSFFEILNRPQCNESPRDACFGGQLSPKDERCHPRTAREGCRRSLACGVGSARCSSGTTSCSTACCSSTRDTRCTRDTRRTRRTRRIGACGASSKSGTSILDCPGSREKYGREIAGHV
jgi:hypothetical protein